MSTIFAKLLSRFNPVFAFFRTISVLHAIAYCFLSRTGVFFLVLMLRVGVAWGQCPTRVVVITQKQVDDFVVQYPNCTTLKHLTIGEHFSPIENIRAFKNIQSVDTLNIWFNNQLRDLSGLENLKTVKDHLLIYNNSGLISLQGLENLESVGKNFQLSDNEKLRNIEAVKNLRSVGTLDVNSNKSLSTIGPLPRLDSISHLNVSGNPILERLPGLARIKGLQSLGISGNQSLTDLSGLENLRTVASDFVLNGNSALKSLSGLKSLRYAPNFTLEGTAIESLNNLPQKVLITNLTMSSNGKLTTIQDDFFGFINDNTTQVTILFNSLLRDLNCLKNLKKADRIYVSINNSLRDLAGLNNLTLVRDHIDITGNESLENLVGLEKCTAIRILRVLDNPNLKAVTGLNPELIINAELDIRNNPKLSQCATEAICNHIFRGALVTLSGNNEACNKVSQLAGQCTPCYIGTTTLTTQSDLEAFAKKYAGCSRLQGDLYIGFNGSQDTVRDLTPLPRFKEITGTLTIDGLSNLAGLDSLQSAKELIISSWKLKNLKGLQNLKNFKGNIHISQIKNLNGLEQLQTVDGTLTIYDNQWLKNLSGLENLRTVQSLIITNNDSLISLAALNPALKIRTALEILRNPQLSTCAPQAICFNITSGISVKIESNGRGCTTVNEVSSQCNDCTAIPVIVFNSQRQVDEFVVNYPTCTRNVNITIESTDARNPITNLNGLRNLELIKNLIIRNNSQLTSLIGLERLKTITENFTIEGNTALVSLAGLTNLESVGDELKIERNNDLQTIGALPKLKLVNSLILTNNPKLTNLSGLESLSTIERNCFLTNSPALTSLTGLRSLTAIGSEFFLQKTSVQNFNGLNQAVKIANIIRITDNPLLTTLEGLGAGVVYYILRNDRLRDLACFRGTTNASVVIIAENNALINLSGAESLTNIKTIQITSNSALQNLNGLENVTRIDELRISTNKALQNLNGLQKLQFVGSFSLFSNAQLNAIAALNPTLQVGGISIYDNKQLDMCGVAAICRILQAQPRPSIRIENNGENCGSIPRVQATCALCPTIGLVSMRQSCDTISINLTNITNLTKNQNGIADFGFVFKLSAIPDGNMDTPGALEIGRMSFPEAANTSLKRFKISELHSGYQQISITLSPVPTSGCNVSVINTSLQINRPIVFAGHDTTLCSNSPIDLRMLRARISNGATTGRWNTEGDGQFLSTADFPAAMTYTPGPRDLANGFATLVLSTGGTGGCMRVFDKVTIRFFRARAVQGLRARAVSDRRAVINWNRLPGTKTYKVDITNPDQSIRTLTWQDTTLELRGLQPGATYRIAVSPVSHCTGNTPVTARTLTMQPIESQYLAGNWNGSATEKTSNIALRRDSLLLMDTNFTGAHELSQNYGNPSSDKYVVGDWDGDGRDNIGVLRFNLLLMDTDFDNKPNRQREFGRGDYESEYLIGDWDGDGDDNVAIRRGADLFFDTDGVGIHDLSYAFGNGTTDQYLVGDWDGNGTDNIGVRRGNTALLDLGNGGAPERSMTFGNGITECQYLVGDWDGDGDDELAVRRNNVILMDFGNGGSPERTQTFGLGDGCRGSGFRNFVNKDQTVVMRTTSGSLFVYPNPMSEQLMMTLPDMPEAPVQLRLFDISGRLVKEMAMTEQSGQMDVSSLTSGVYILQLLDDAGRKVAVEKIVKQ